MRKYISPWMSGDYAGYIYVRINLYNIIIAAIYIGNTNKDHRFFFESRERIGELSYGSTLCDSSRDAVDEHLICMGYHLCSKEQFDRYNLLV